MNRIEYIIEWYTDYKRETTWRSDETDDELIVVCAMNDAVSNQATKGRR